MNRRERRKAAAHGKQDARLDRAEFDETGMTVGEIMWEEMQKVGSPADLDRVRIEAARVGKTPAELLDTPPLLDGKVLHGVRIHKRRPAS